MRVAQKVRSVALLILAMAGPTLALALAAGCRSGSGRTPQTGGQPAVSSPAAVAFAGSAACAECHQAEFDLQRATNHARTLRKADRQSLGALTPPVGPIPHSAYAITEEAGHLRFIRSDQPSTGETMQWAFGSGKTAVTYVGKISSKALTEFRMSYSPHGQAWVTTPGQTNDANVSLGMVYELGMAQRCILCHADRVDPVSGGPAQGALGVGCESCHGPGSAHIAAARVPHATDFKMEKMGQWGATRIDAVCARCHRSIDDVALVGAEASNTARFQPYGLEQSPCFKQSGNRLSCITCHNPHSDAGDTQRHYEQVCLSCHSSAPAAHAAVHTTLCPVNPREGCIGCHMPKRAAFPGLHVPLSIADHLIWAYRPHHESPNAKTNAGQ